MSFETNRLAFEQEHFTVVEIVLPYVTSCTPRTGLSQAYNTPLTCDEAADSEYTVYLATENLPLEYGHPRGSESDVIELPEDNVYPVVLSITERVTELQPGKGLALRGSATLLVRDFDGDPGPTNTTTAGTFFGKLAARNVMQNKKITIRQFHVNSDGIYTEGDSQDREYLIESFENRGNGTWAIRARDPLASAQEDAKGVFPLVTGGTLRSDINASVTSIPVDANTDWEQFPRPYVIAIGDELMKVSSVTGNQTGSASLTVGTRGASISFTNTLSTTTASAHSSGDAVQICHTSDQQSVERLLQDICWLGLGLYVADYDTDEGTVSLELGELVQVKQGHTAGGTIGYVYKSLTVSGSTDLSLEDFTDYNAWEELGFRQGQIEDWKAEIAEWHSATAAVDTIIVEPEKAASVLAKVLSDFVLDMWWNPVQKLVELSAISVWKTTSGLKLTEGKEINYDTLRIIPKPDQQYTRAFVVYDKPNKLLDNSIENFRGLVVEIDSSLEAEGLYGESKVRDFKPSIYVDVDQAQLLVQRTVARFGEVPREFQWETEERFLSFDVGDVRDIVSPENQDAEGDTATVRAQVTAVQPVLTDAGRFYKCKALSYLPALATAGTGGGAEITLTGTLTNVNLYTEVGAPGSPVDVTVIVDGATICSDDIATPAMRAGPFPAGSTLKIILINSADWQAKGGNAGVGGASVYEAESGQVVPDPGGDGEDGGICFDAEGIDTDIYLGGSVDGYTALGTLKAPGGGGGGGGGGGEGTNPYGGSGGGGGAGCNIGNLGGGGNAFLGTSPVDGNDGTAGDTSGNGGSGGTSTVYGGGGGDGGDWGQAGADGSDGLNTTAGSPGAGGTGGAAGSGITDSSTGATINVFTDGNSGRFINGSGDTPATTT